MHTKCRKRILCSNFRVFAGIRFAHTIKDTLRAMPLNSYSSAAGFLPYQSCFFVYYRLK